MSIALDPRRFGPINDALQRLLELEGADREAAAHDWCRAHPDLADDLRRLLALAEDQCEVLAGAAVGALVPTTGVIGEQLGDWTLQAPLGRGGSGEVWLAAGSGAHRDQRAAIKRPLRADDGGRFERERRRLAQLSDAGIARLIDSGVDADGRPWIAMEYVDGERIDRWCDQRRLSLRARLALLRQVASIVHGAHRALLVHRDLKPANVLVGGDDAPQVKLVDFGIAKDLGVDAAPTIDPMLTPQYASPEQLAGGSITIASDIYQLGLLAHEILSGAVPPLAAERVAGLPPMALAAAQGGHAVAEARAATPATLQRELRGDVQAIIDLATRPEPALRYASALQMADDLGALLEGRPVHARRGGWRYRALRFVGRHRYAVVAFALLGIATVAYALLYVQQARAIARQAQENVAVRDTLVSLLRQADPLYSGQPDVDVSPWLRPALALARRELATQPTLLAEVLALGANADVRRGDYRSAEALYREALALAPPGQRLAPLGRLGEALHYSSRYSEAEAVLAEAMAAWRGTPRGLEVPRAYFDLLHSRGDYVRARAVLDEIDVPAGSFASAMKLRDLGILARDGAEPRAARESLEASLALLETLNADALSKSTVQLALARWQVLYGDPAVARRLAAATLPAIMRTYRDGQVVPGMARQVLAQADLVDGAAQRAEAELSRVLERDYAGIAPGNVLRAYVLLDRAEARARLGASDAAAADLEAAERILRDVSTPPHPRASEALVLRAWLQRARGQPHEDLLADAVALRVARFGADHPLAREAQAWVDAFRADPTGARDAGHWRRAAHH